MTERINQLTQLTLAGKMYAYPRETAFDREDLFLSKQQRESKQLCEYILNQEPVLTEYSKMTGFFNCDSTVVGDAFRRMGHENFDKMIKQTQHGCPSGIINHFFDISFGICTTIFLS